MGKLKTKLVNFDKETGKATYIYSYKNQLFKGEAQCHEDDMDMCSELVGLKYAETRAYLEYLKVRKNELKTRLATMEGLLRNLQTSKDFDITSKYGKKIQVAICDTKCDLFEIKQAIDNIPPYLKQDIKSREFLYTRVREKRKKERAE